MNIEKLTLEERGKYFEKIDTGLINIKNYEYALLQPIKHELARRINSGELFNFYIHGKAGLGKTVTVNQSIYYLIRYAKWRYKHMEYMENEHETGMGVLYIANLSELVNKLNAFETRREWYEKCMDYKFVIFDNVFRYATERSCKEVFSILDNRLTSKIKYTGLISNPMDMSMGEFFTDSLARRINDFCQIYELKEKLFDSKGVENG